MQTMLNISAPNSMPMSMNGVSLVYTVVDYESWKILLSVYKARMETTNTQLIAGLILLR